MKCINREFVRRWSANASDLLRELHWLLIRQRVQFKAKDCGLLAYLHDDLHNYQPTRVLRSSTVHLLQEPLVLTSVAAAAATTDTTTTTTTTRFI